MFITRQHLPGLLICVLLASIALFLDPFLPLNALMIALLMGMTLSAFRPPPENWGPGIVFAMKKVLRLAIILLGLRISILELQRLGLSSLVLILLCVSLSFGFTLAVGRWLKLSPKGNILMASGISICGASAILAADAVIEAEDRDTVYAIATITLLGTTAMLSYPLLQKLFHFSTLHYSLWVGASVHEVAQVVAAGFAHGEASGELATMVKLTRVVLLVPIMLLLVVYQRKQNQKQRQDLSDKQFQVPIPWFVLGFLVMMLLNPYLASEIKTRLSLLGQFTLTLSMAALGLETRLDKLRSAGLKPLYLGVLSSLFISLLSLGLIFTLQP